MTAPNDCQFSPLLSPFQDGELPPDRLSAVAAHVRGCQACAAELAEIRQLARAVRSVERPAAPATERWESAVLDAAREEGLLAADGRPGPAATLPAMRLVGAEPPAGTSPVARRVVEPPHLWFVRRLSAAAAVVFLVAAGHTAYQHFGHASDDPMKTTPASYRPADGSAGPNAGKSAPSTSDSGEHRDRSDPSRGR